MDCNICGSKGYAYQNGQWACIDCVKSLAGVKVDENDYPVYDGGSPALVVFLLGSFLVGMLAVCLIAMIALGGL